MSETSRPLNISVVGAGVPDAAAAAHAYEVGRLLARRGAVVVCGGLGGVMAEACRGAMEEGGLTVGILPGRDPREANPWVLIPLATGMGDARNVIVAGSADALIAIGGALGTLSEIAIALAWGRPVVGLGTWELDPARLGAVRLEVASGPGEAVELALDLAARSQCPAPASGSRRSGP